MGTDSAVLFPGNFMVVFLALTPIIWLFVSLTYLKMPAFRACPIGLALSLLIAVFVWKLPVALAVQAALEGGGLALIPILWVIIAAFFTFNLSTQTGAMQRIKALMSNVSGDRRIQALMIAWGFGGFLESVAGFGTAVAIPAAILIALGFEPFFAAVICLIANTVAVAFGVIGIPVTTLAKIADLPLAPLSMDVVLQLTPFALLVPLLMVYTITRSWRGFEGVWITTLAAGLSFSVSQFLTAKFVGAELPAVVGSVVSFAATVVCAKLFPPAKEWRFPHESEQQTQTSPSRRIGALREQLISWAPYILLLILVLGTSKLVPGIHKPLAGISSSFLFYAGPGGKPLTIDWILTPGTLIMLSALLGGLIQGASPRLLAITFVNTVVQLQKTCVTVIAIVSMAKVLGYSGMVSAIAVALAGATGVSYPFFAPLIGALGTFLTGSDTSSNVLFGALQKEIALQIGASPSWIAAANTSGACAGKLISPQSIAIAASAAGLTGKEGELLKATVNYAAAFTLGLGVIIYAFAS